MADSFKYKKAVAGLEKFSSYEACLMKPKNYKKILKALETEDYDKVTEIFNECAVPLEHQQTLMTFAKDCFEMRYCQW